LQECPATKTSNRKPMASRCAKSSHDLIQLGGLSRWPHYLYPRAAEQNSPNTASGIARCLLALSVPFGVDWRPEMGVCEFGYPRLRLCIPGTERGPQSQNVQPVRTGDLLLPLLRIVPFEGVWEIRARHRLCPLSTGRSNTGEFTAIRESSGESISAFDYQNHATQGKKGSYPKSVIAVESL
jgi:hypothetical protein